MTVPSPARLSWPTLPGLHLVHEGKVRNTYELPGYPDLLLQEATDAISVFDFMLNFLVPGKGVGLTILSHFVFRLLHQHRIQTHMIAAGAGIDQYLPEALRGNPELQSRAMVVRKLRMIRDSATGLPIELIDRSYLAGSAKTEYAKSSTIAGIPMPVGLQPGDMLPYMIFNPTNKAEEGHDTPLPRERVEAEHPIPTRLYMRASQIVADHAFSRGLIKADGKGECGYYFEEHFGAHLCCIGDEFGTFDCCRYWDRATWVDSRQESVRKEPPALDKQVARNAAALLGFDKLDPKNPAHIACVQNWQPEQSLIDDISGRMNTLITRLCGKSPQDYLREEMGIAI